MYSKSWNEYVSGPLDASNVWKLDPKLTQEDVKKRMEGYKQKEVWQNELNSKDLKTQSKQAPEYQKRVEKLEYELGMARGSLGKVQTGKTAQTGIAEKRLKQDEAQFALSYEQRNRFHAENLEERRAARRDRLSYKDPVTGKTYAQALNVDIVTGKQIGRAHV